MCLHCVSEGADLVYFTRTPQKREKWGEKKEEVVESDITLSSSGRRLSLSGLFFKIHISYGAFRYVFSMESGAK